MTCFTAASVSRSAAIARSYAGPSTVPPPVPIPRMPCSISRLPRSVAGLSSNTHLVLASSENAIRPSRSSWYASSTTWIAPSFASSIFDGEPVAIDCDLSITITSATRGSVTSVRRSVVTGRPSSTGGRYQPPDPQRAAAQHDGAVGEGRGDVGRLALDDVEALGAQQGGHRRVADDEDRRPRAHRELARERRGPRRRRGLEVHGHAHRRARPGRERER